MSTQIPSIEDVILDPDVRKKNFPKSNLENGSFFLHIPASNRGHTLIMGVDTVYKDSNLKGIAPVFMNGGPTTREMSELTSLIRRLLEKDHSVQVSASRSLDEPKNETINQEHVISFHKATNGKEDGLYRKEMPLLLAREKGSEAFMPYTLGEIAEKYERENTLFEVKPSSSGAAVSSYEMNFLSPVPLQARGSDAVFISASFEYDPTDSVFQNKGRPAPETAIKNLSLIFDDLETSRPAQITIHHKTPNLDMRHFGRDQNVPITAFPSIVSNRPVDIMLKGKVTEQTLDALFEKMKEYKKLPHPPTIHLPLNALDALADYTKKHPEKAAALPEIRLSRDGLVESSMTWNNPAKNNQNTLESKLNKALDNDKSPSF